MNCSSRVSRRTLSSCTENFTFSSSSRASCTSDSVPTRRSSSSRSPASTASMTRLAPASSSSTATRRESAASSDCRSCASPLSLAASWVSRSVFRAANWAIWPSSRAMPASSDSRLARRDSTRIATSRAVLRSSSARRRDSASISRSASRSPSSALRRSSRTAIASTASPRRARAERLPAVATSSAPSSSASSAASCCILAPRCSALARSPSSCERRPRWSAPA